MPEGMFGLDGGRIPVEMEDVVVKFARGDLRIAQAELLARLEGGVLVSDPIEADVNGGRVSGSARIVLEGPVPSHSLNLDAKGVEIDSYLAPLTARVLPLLAGDEKDGTAKGTADLSLRVEAAGRSVDELKRSLRGDGVAALNDVAIEARTWLTQLLQASGRGGDRMALDPVRVPFRIGDERVTFEPIDLRASDVLVRLSGHTTLQGELDCLLRVKSTSEVRGVEKYAKWLDPEGFLPLRLRGTVTKPSIVLPGVGDLLEGALSRGGDGLTDDAREILDDLVRRRR
jgi:hypothetical protein